jgi:hypothetical protein
MGICGLHSEDYKDVFLMLTWRICGLEAILADTKEGNRLSLLRGNNVRALIDKTFLGGWPSYP